MAAYMRKQPYGICHSLLSYSSVMKMFSEGCFVSATLSNSKKATHFIFRIANTGIGAGIDAVVIVSGPKVVGCTVSYAFSSLSGYYIPPQ